MPQVTVYIREADLEAWKGVIRKSEFIHNALQYRSTYDGAKIELRETIEMPINPKMNVHTLRPKDIVKEIPEIKGVSVGFCPHGAAKGLCKIESCNKKYR
jgi:hypothetical protein